MDTAERMIMVPTKTAKQWVNDLRKYWFTSGDDGEEFNNDEIIAMTEQIEAMIKAAEKD